MNLEKLAIHGDIVVGDVVEFTGCSQEQINWGNNDDPWMLQKGKCYVVEQVEVHRQHTKLKLQGIEGMFNSVCFIDIDDLLDL